ncbi:MAG: hypothetical protein JEY96_19450 [Bacteroidales bacterium]|nr:hypothetical protein [Bacteroidales bacterium]
MRKLTYILIAVQIVLMSCNQVDNDLTEWNKIKNEKDFSAFFNFAIATEDSLLISECIDSLEKYKPKNGCLVLKYYDYYNETEDTILNSGFNLYDKCGLHENIKSRNIIFVNIDENNVVEIEYSDSSFLNYHNLLHTLFDTIGESYSLPEFFITTFEDREYIARKLITFISLEISPDTINKKSSWETVIKANKLVLESYDKVRDSKAQEIFSSEFMNLESSEKKLIINLVPVYLENNFYFSFINIPPPPPPPCEY